MTKKSCHQATFVFLSSFSTLLIAIDRYLFIVQPSAAQISSRAAVMSFYLFTFSFYSFYPYLYTCRSFFLSYRSKNIRVPHPIKKQKQFPSDGFGVPPISPSFSLISLFTFTFFYVFSISLSLSTIRRFCLLFPYFHLFFHMFLTNFPFHFQHI